MSSSTKCRRNPPCHAQQIKLSFSRRLKKWLDIKQKQASKTHKHSYIKLGGLKLDCMHAPTGKSNHLLAQTLVLHVRRQAARHTVHHVPPAHRSTQARPHHRPGCSPALQDIDQVVQHINWVATGTHWASHMARNTEKKGMQQVKLALAHGD